MLLSLVAQRNHPVQRATFVPLALALLQCLQIDAPSALIHLVARCTRPHARLAPTQVAVLPLVVFLPLRISAKQVTTVRHLLVAHHSWHAQRVTSAQLVLTAAPQIHALRALFLSVALRTHNFRRVGLAMQAIALVWAV